MLSPFFKFYIPFFILNFYFIFPSILLTFSLSLSPILTLDFLSLLHLLYLPLFLTAFWLLTLPFSVYQRGLTKNHFQRVSKKAFSKWTPNLEDICELQILKKLMQKNFRSELKSLSLFRRILYLYEIHYMQLKFFTRISLKYAVSLWTTKIHSPLSTLIPAIINTYTPYLSPIVILYGIIDVAMAKHEHVYFTDESYV